MANVPRITRRQQLQTEPERQITFSRRHVGSEVEPSPLGFDANTPFLYGRTPLLAGTREQRRCRARFVDDDVPVGDWRDIVEVTAHL